jgi:eukaryotic-like serine/threonine-protein kinase
MGTVSMGTLAGFTLERPIGSGTMGEVWRATAADGTRVAIKVARPAVVEDPRLLRLIDGEVRAMARLDHPAVVWVYDHGHVPASTDTPFVPGAPYIVLEHCGGGTLDQQRISTWTDLRPVAEALLDALAHTHAHGIVHRDLKPGNILWPGPTDVRRGPKLGDFGIAYAVGADAGRATAGTPFYMPPEQASGGPIGPWSDLYALGAVLWEQCTGSPPHTGSSLLEILAACRRGHIPPLAPRFDLPDGLEGWLRRLLARSPTDRFQRAAHAAEALARIEPDGSRPPPGWRSPRSAGPRLRLQGAGLALLPMRAIDVAGRDAERERMWEVLRRALGGRVEVLVLRGVSGIGKTRLATWIAARAAEIGSAEPVVVDRGDPEPLQTLVTGLLQPARRADEVFAALASRPSVADAAARRLISLLEAPETRWGSVPSVRQIVRALATERPRLIVFDDVQQCESAIRLARALLAERETHPAPLMVVLTAEEEALASLPEQLALLDGLEALGATALRLGPLQPAEQEALLDALVGLDPESHSALLSAAGGHPGYLVARVQGWAQEGELVPTARGFRLREGARDAAPPSLAALWEERLVQFAAALEPEALELLEASAAVGRVVDEALWEEATSDPDGKLADSGQHRIEPRKARARLMLVDRLIAAGLATETDHGFAFAHPALVEALAARARAAGRHAAHHRACAVHLARRPQPANALRLGLHLAEAGQHEAAVDALRAGIRHGFTHADRRPLIAELERAEQCADLAGLAADDPRRAKLLQLRCIVSIGLGRIDDAAAAASGAWQIAEAREDRRLMAEAAMRLVDTHALGNDWGGARTWLHRYLEVEDASPKRHWGGIVRARLGRLARDDGDTAAATRWYAEAEALLLECLEGAADPASVLGSLVELYSWSDKDERMLEVSRRAEQVAAEAGQLSEQLFAVSKQIEAAMGLERWDEARATGRRALDLAALGGDLRSAVFVRAQLANIELRVRDWAAARPLLLAALERVGALRHPWQEGMLWLLLAECELRTSDWGAFDRALARLRAVAPRVPTAERQLVEGLRAWAAELDAMGQSERALDVEEVVALAHSEVDLG